MTTTTDDRMTLDEAVDDLAKVLDEVAEKWKDNPQAFRRVTLWRLALKDIRIRRETKNNTGNKA